MDGKDGKVDGSRSAIERRLHRVARPDESLKGAAYQGAMEAVLAVVIAALIGYWADQRFGTSPRWLIVGTVIGFCSFVLRLVRMGKLVAQASAEAQAAEAERKREAAARSREREAREDRDGSTDRLETDEPLDWLGLLRSQDERDEQQEQAELREREEEQRREQHEEGQEAQQERREREGLSRRPAGTKAGDEPEQ